MFICILCVGSIQVIGVNRMQRIVKGRQANYIEGQHPAGLVVEQVLRTMSKPVYLLNSTTLLQLKKDGYPSVFGHGDHRDMDCSRWCLAGVSHTWNQLLYAALIQS